MAEAQKHIFYNHAMDRPAMRRMIGRLVTCRGNGYASLILDQLKTVGFEYATRTGISLGIDDLLASPFRASLVEDTEYHAQSSEESHERGCIHALEKLRQVVETWHTTSEFLKREMSLSFQMVELLNPVHMMSYSGARGSISQVHQLVGMRGLMSDPQGRVIDLPIQTNLREGLSLAEYILSCYGARKGVVDTAIRTADAGYLTRRLVEIAQHLVISNVDCGTFRGVYLHTIQAQQGVHSISHKDRLLGRVLARAVYVNERCIAARNQDIGAALADRLAVSIQSVVLVRSALTCKRMSCACQLCYGWSSNYGKLVNIGEAIGIIAGQSIGEPGTQLTLRTFHTGGVFTGDIANHVRAPLSGTIWFESTMCQPTRNRHGRPAWRCLQELIVIIKSKTKTHELAIPYNSLLVVANHQYVSARQVVAEIRTSQTPLREVVRKHIHSDVQGEIIYRDRLRRLNRVTSHYAHPIADDLTTHNTDHIWILSAQLSEAWRAPVCTVYQIQDHVQIELPIARQGAVQMEAEPCRESHCTKRSAMRFRKQRLTWHADLKQASAGVSLEAPILSVLIGSICSLLCPSAHNPETLRFVILCSLDQFRVPLQRAHKRLNRVALLKRSQPHLAEVRSTSSTRHAIDLRGLRRVRVMSYNGVHTPIKLFGLVRAHTAPVQIAIASLGLLGLRQRCASHGGILTVSADRDHSSAQCPSKAVLFTRCYRVGENKLTCGIGYGLYQEHSSTISQLACWLKQAYQLPKLGQLLSKGVVVTHWQQPAEFGRVITVSEIELVLRVAKCHLVVAQTQVCGYCGEGIDEQETLITLLYEQLRASDIVQGLPKAEQLLEARFNTEVLSKLQYDLDTWMSYLFRLPQPYAFSAEKSLELAQIDLVDRIQAVYLSQAVRISDKHIEVIVRQMSCRVVFVEGVYHARHSPALLPGELVELERARKISSVFQVLIEYKPMFLGITTGSLTSDSFLAAASFQRTTKVLGTSALQGKMDWIRGLQESVIFGALIPAGTGCKQVVCQVKHLQPRRGIFHHSANKTFLKQLAQGDTSSECANRDTARVFFYSAKQTVANHTINGKLTHAVSRLSFAAPIEMIDNTRVTSRTRSYTKRSADSSIKMCPP